MRLFTPFIDFTQFYLTLGNSSRPTKEIATRRTGAAAVRRRQGDRQPLPLHAPSRSAGAKLRWVAALACQRRRAPSNEPRLEGHGNDKSGSVSVDRKRSDTLRRPSAPTRLF